MRLENWKDGFNGVSEYRGNKIIGSGVRCVRERVGC